MEKACPYCTQEQCVCYDNLKERADPLIAELDAWYASRDCVEQLRLERGHWEIAWLAGYRAAQKKHEKED